METGLPEVNPSGWPARLLRWASAPLLALGLALAWDGASAPAPAFRLGVSDESGWLWQAVFREAGAAATDATGLAPQSLWRIDGLSLTLRHAPGAWQSPRALRQAQLAGELDGWLALPADPLGRLGTAPRQRSSIVSIPMQRPSPWRWGIASAPRSRRSGARKPNCPKPQSAGRRRPLRCTFPGRNRPRLRPGVQAALP